MTTPQQLFGIDLPIIQAPMAGAQDHRLAAAVSNAGGLGSLPAGLLSPQQLREELAALQAQTARPFNVNFFCHAPPALQAEREVAWRTTLAPYYAELGVAASANVVGPTRAPFSADAAAIIQAVRPAVVSFHFGLPSNELLAQVRTWGATVLASATTVAEARWLDARGVDVTLRSG